MRVALLLGLITIVGVTEIFADLALKQWAIQTKAEKSHWGLIAGAAIYAVVGVLYGLSLLFGKLSIANTIWQVFSIVVVFGIGVYMFGEKPSIGQWISTVVILVGLGLMLSAEPPADQSKKSFWTTEWAPRMP